MTLPQLDAFGAPAVPSGVAVLGIPASIGQLTAYHAQAVGEPRGTVLFVPGFTGSKEDFRDFLPLLSALGWDVWAYSQRGQGDSVGPVGAGNYSLELFAADVFEVAAIVGNGAPVHLLGHSFGGIVAPEAVIAHPEAFLSLTVLCSGPNGWAGRHAETSEILAEGGSMGLWNRNNPHTVGQADELLTPDMAFLRLRAARTSSDNLRAGAYILRTHVDRSVEIAAAGLPVLIAHGEFDDAWPIEAQRAMAVRIGADYQVIPGGAHSPQLEAPGATVAILDRFWANHQPAIGTAELQSTQQYKE
ncbi:Lysophospholipase, alpha-beta hydrolase superfamily [Arthrobacter alpinus]|uniref:Lysophospholipase, alpha-beta hydrolase superfamily n=1 Tax=Arthrobacter alpinus TaxID=656366 RepID=A0A1H5ICM0_9MICC|nr:alpha/beta hydrolase [Arthrobacter alpinus]SEE37930.1 Lysophospholipase, alpha-beta hydrolase superfamily [Arthrobacter alpinus]